MIASRRNPPADMVDAAACAAMLRRQEMPLACEVCE
jgi:hypothetical protein